MRSRAGSEPTSAENGRTWCEAQLRIEWSAFAITVAGRIVPSNAS
jgi:hypothetical protein